MGFEKIYIIFCTIVIFLFLCVVELWREKRKLEQENKRMRRILIWREER